MTEDLIERLANDLRPTPRHAVRHRLLAACLGGLTVAVLAMLILLGPRDVGEAAGTAMFWVKSGYTLALALAGAWAAERLSRPGATAGRPAALAMTFVFVIAVLATAGYCLAPSDARAAIVWGSSALVCPIYIVGLSVPLLIAILSAMRRLAPTALEGAGAAAGLMAGGLGAWVYSFHCTENGLPFLALWYTLGVAIVIVLGALAGRLALRW